MRLKAGLNTIKLNKGKTYLVGFVSDPAVAMEVGGSAFAGTASTGIATIGNTCISAASLNTIPLSPSATDGMTLGALVQLGGVLSSSIGIDDLSQALGYDEDLLGRFGQFDDRVRKGLNPDINGDGVYDDAQGLGLWGLTYVARYGVAQANVNYAGSTIAGSSPGEIFKREEDPRVDFSLNDNMSIMPDDDVTVTWTIDPEVTVLDASGNRVTSFTTTGGISDGFRFFGTGSDRYGREHPFNVGTFPYDGTYKFSLPGYEFMIRNVILRTGRSDFEGEVLPIFSIAAYQDGSLESIGWKWVGIEDGSIGPVAAEEVGLKIKEFWFGLHRGNLFSLADPTCKPMESEYASSGSCAWPEGLYPDGATYTILSAVVVDISGNWRIWDFQL